MKVTILGSCRQTPIKQYVEVTSIQERLTYPHYTKEIIQAIEFCKGEHSIRPEDTQYCFRTGILNKCQLSHLDFISEFNATDIFLVEIASRIKYTWKGNYLHHICEEETYGFPYRNEITTVDQSDQEIEDDLDTIRRLLYPKPFIVVSHISTYTNSKRHSLCLLLQTLTYKYGIPFYNPSTLLEQYSISELFQSEKIICHYTKFGEQVVAKHYKQLIDTVIESQQLKIKSELTQLYHSDYDRVKYYSFQGFGDYLRGCMYLYKFCKDNNRFFSINFSNMLLSKYLYCKTYRTLEEAKQTVYIHPVFGQSQKIHTARDVFTNHEISFPIDKEMITFIKDYCLQPKLGLIQYINQQKLRLRLDTKSYTVIHIRLGDTFEWNSSTCPDDNPCNKKFSVCKIVDILNKIFSNPYVVEKLDSTLFITDSIFFDSILSSIGCKITGLRKCHIGHYSATSEEMLDTLTEFFLLSESSSIIQFSSYSWGSTFTNMIHHLYDIPIHRVLI